MIEFFEEWFETRRAALEAAGISLDIVKSPQDYNLRSIHAGLQSSRNEWSIQLWENGMCDSYFVEWQDLDRGVEPMHHEFTSEHEMRETLEWGLKRVQ
jgi:hypothetical protein